MVKPGGKPDRSVIWLSKYLSLALTLPASVVAGYFLGALATRWLNFPLLKALGVVLGMAAGLIQIVRELLKDTKA